MTQADLMTVQIGFQQGVAVLDVAGKITIEQGTRRLHSQVRNLLRDGNSKILLDLGDVSYIDSTGVGALVASYTSVRSAAGQLLLCSVDRRVKKLLESTNLLSVFDVVSDRDTAFRSLA